MATNNFITDPSSTSVQTVKQEIYAYLATKPDYERWKDFYASSAGTVLIDMLASVLTVLSYRVIVARREAYLKYAQNYTSHVAIAENLGYNVFRGQNARIKITFNSSTTRTLDKYEIIGSVKDFDLIVLADTILNAGVDTEVECTLGAVNEQEITVPTDLLTTFRFTNPLVTTDLSLYLNATEITYSERILSLADNEYIVMTNGFDSVDVLFLNQAAPLYATGDKLKIEYIERNDLTFTLSDVAIDETEYTAVEISEDYIAQESSTSIKIKAPLYHETQYTIRGRKDFQKLMLQQNPELIAANGRDVSPAIVETTYLREDKLLYLEDEFAGVNTVLNDESLRPYGIPASRVAHPVRGYLELNVIVNLKNTTSEDIVAMVEAIIAPYEDGLETSIDLYDIEEAIENNDYVKTARVTLAYQSWTSEALKRPIDHVITSSSISKLLEFSAHNKKTDASEPTWPTIVGERIIDGGIIWEGIEDDRCNLPEWAGNTYFEKGITIKPTDDSNLLRYLVVAGVFKSASTEPTWPTTEGEEVEDNELTWITRAIQGTPSSWATDTNYEIGSEVVPISANGFMYQAIALKSKTGASEPDISAIDAANVVEDGDIRWLVRDLTNQVVIPKWNIYMQIDQNITINI